VTFAEINPLNHRFVIPAQAGIQHDQILDTGLRRCDGLFDDFYKTTP
jgi:hypothetical protein